MEEQVYASQIKQRSACKPFHRIWHDATTHDNNKFLEIKIKYYTIVVPLPPLLPGSKVQGDHKLIIVYRVFQEKGRNILGGHSMKFKFYVRNDHNCLQSAKQPLCVKLSIVHVSYSERFPS
jgi:hypothetical protein